MMNNKGFAKHEVLTVIALIIVIIAIILGLTLDTGNSQKFKTMKMSAQAFGNVVGGQMEGFDVYLNEHYLSEVLDNNMMDEIKSPFSGNGCDVNESKVYVVNGRKYVTLRCDEYLINNEDSDKVDSMKIYKVSEWSEEQLTEDDQVVTVYNCVSNGKEVFDTYLEQFNFIYNVNKEFNTEVDNISAINKTCEVKSKTMYRTLTKVG